MARGTDAYPTTGGCSAFGALNRQARRPIGKMGGMPDDLDYQTLRSLLAEPELWTPEQRSQMHVASEAAAPDG
jgi:hypothetical protein